jgi:anti-sigma regulatory factor (Ser/Thr protein kinase)
MMGLDLRRAGVPDDVRRICEHGFTEMLNNAIEHSGGTLVQYFVEQEEGRIPFLIQDDGIGIFEKIRSYFGLEDHRQAILELSKGKLTTDTSRHSGEGIFFTSRMFDRFIIGSNNLGLSHRTGEDDWLIETESFDRPGTLVSMEIGVDSQRTPKEVFDMFARPEADDYRFSRTHVPLKLAKFGLGGLVSRSEAKRVLARFEGFKEVRLDFEGIDSIGQAFADEIFRVFKLAHPEIEVVAVRASEPVEQMIKRAQSQQPEPDSVPLVIPTARDLLDEIRAGKESRAIIPVPAKTKLASGDRVTFAEAAFDRMGIPSLIIDGESVSVSLTKADETGDSYGTMRLVAIGWDSARHR